MGGWLIEDCNGVMEYILFNAGDRSFKESPCAAPVTTMGPLIAETCMHNTWTLNKYLAIRDTKVPIPMIY